MLATVACAAGESERTNQLLQRQPSRDALLTAGVVQTLLTPTSQGRLIYEKPADLSYDSLRVKRPDLVRAADRPKR